MPNSDYRLSVKTYLTSNILLSFTDPVTKITTFDTNKTADHFVQILRCTVTTGYDGPIEKIGPCHLVGFFDVESQPFLLVNATHAFLCELSDKMANKARELMNSIDWTKHNKFGVSKCYKMEVGM